MIVRRIDIGVDVAGLLPPRLTSVYGRITTAQYRLLIGRSAL